MDKLSLEFKEAQIALVNRRFDDVLSILKRNDELASFILDDESLLHTCVGHNINFLENLLQAGVDPDLKDTTGSTLLMSFSSLNDISNLKLFLSYGADVNITNFCGERAFSYACARGNFECAKILYNSNAEIDFMIGHSKSAPYDWALRSGNVDLIEWLETKRKK